MSRTVTLMFVATAMLWAVVVSGCGPGGPVVLDPPEDATNPTGPARGEVRLDRLGVTLEPIARGFDRPLFVTHAGDRSGRLYVVEQGGRVHVIDGPGSTDVFLDMSDLISDGGERGLLGLAFSPDYESSGEFYVNHTDPSGATVIARYRADDPSNSTPNLEGPETLLRIEQPYSNHNGGCLLFDAEGLLWIGMGDGGSGGDPQDRAQDPDSLLGKMLTLDVSLPEPKPVVRISGVRNPWRYSFDRETGDLWIADVGQNAREEVTRLGRDETYGANLGWNRWEGTRPYPEGSSGDRDGFVFPLIEYGHDVGRSITGGYVYRGTASPSLAGTYLFADFERGWIDGFRAVSTESPLYLADPTRLVAAAGRPSSFGEDEVGEVYVCDFADGVVSRIVARPVD
jgi:glucose/arabinose dehydrogenase